MSQYIHIRHLNDLHSLCSSKQEEKEVLLNAISDLVDSGESLENIEDLISQSDFNHERNNF